MIKTMIFGANGKIGQIISQLAENDELIEVVAGVDRTPSKHANYFPTFKDPHEFEGEVDVIIDFSHPSYLKILLHFAKTKKIPVIIATTGFSKDQLDIIEEISKEIPIFYSSNMSLGVNILNNILKQYTKLLNEHFDIEIIEKHHNKKLDAPSGTALLLATTINETLNGSNELIYGRRGEHKRDEKEIGIHSIRGGTIAGEHLVLFAGTDELLELKHTALSKDIFAFGAIKAAKFIVKQQAGYYTMDNLFTKDDDNE